MTRLARRWLCLLPALVAAEAWAAGTLRCDSRIIDEGSLAAETVAACGEPAYRDLWTFQQGQGYVAEAEEWYYDFGPAKLLRVIKLRHGRVVDIDSDGYGFDKNTAGSCQPAQITPAISKYRLLRLCGEPVQRRAMGVLSPLRSRSTMSGSHERGRLHREEYLVPLFREEWIYNFGSSHLMRVVTLEDGRVKRVESGDRGFDVAPARPP